MKATLFLTALLGASLAVGYAEETTSAISTQTDYLETVDTSWDSATSYNTIYGQEITSAWTHHVSLRVHNDGSSTSTSADDTNSVSVGSADSLINASSGTAVGDILFDAANDTDVTYVTDWYTYSTVKVSSTTSRDNGDVAFGSNTTRTSATFIVQNGEVVFDNVTIHAYDTATSTSSTSELSDIQMNLSIGTTYGQTGTLTLTNGTVLETTAIFSVIGGEGGKGIVNVDGATLKTQQITLGSSGSVQSLGTYGLDSSKKYITYYNEYLHSYDQFINLISDGNLAEMSYGTINITNGGTMTVAEGNDSCSSSTNQLQIQNGEINVSGTGSTFTYSPMDTEEEGGHATGTIYFGKVDYGYGSGDFKASINVTDGGTATFDCQNIYMATGQTYNLVDSTETVTINASGTDENGTASTITFTAEAVMNLGYTASSSEDLLLTDATVNVLAEEGGKVNISSDSDVMLGGGSDVAATVTMQSTGANSEVNLTSAGTIIIDDGATGDTVTIGASDSGTTTVKGAVDNYGTANVTATSGGTVSIEKYTNEAGATTIITTAQAEASDGTTSSGTISIGTYENYGNTTLVLDSATDVAVTELRLVSGSWTMTTTDSSVAALTLDENTTTYFYVSADEELTATSTAITAAGTSEVSVESGALMTLVFNSSDVATLSTSSLSLVLVSAEAGSTLTLDEANVASILANMSYLDSAGNTLTISDATLSTTTNADGATELVWTGTITSSSLVVVPEPATATLSLLALAALAARRRRK